MSQKNFCDLCEAEMAVSSHYLSFDFGRLTVTMQYGRHANQEYSGDFCDKCVIAAICEYTGIYPTPKPEEKAA